MLLFFSFFKKTIPFLLTVLNLNTILRIMLFSEKIPKMNCELMLTYDTPALRQTGSRNATKNGHIQNVCSMCIKINKVGKQEVGI